MSNALRVKHRRNAEEAKRLYVQGQIIDFGATDWHEAKRQSRKGISAALRASNYLNEVEEALNAEGVHMRVFRHLTAPPVSQDQFKLVCPEWPKSSEKPGRGLAPPESGLVAERFYALRDKSLCPWVALGGKPSRSQLRDVLNSVAPMLAMQQFATLRRNRLASAQENAALDILRELRWKQLPSKLVDERADLPARCFMYKTRFATSHTPQEVDIACGLGKTVVLAIECKVTNDATNSVKRVNDVLKKATSWREHWGSFIVTAALLQGVIAPKDVFRLLDSGIEVFWSHELAEFEAWIKERCPS